jgi:hypothetical protein
MPGMLFRLLIAVLAVSVLACAGSPRPATETAAPAIQHFFGPQAPVAEKPAPAEAPRVTQEPAREAPPAPEAPPAEALPAPASADAIQHFFGEAAAAPEPEEPAKDRKDSKDAKDGEKVDAFEHFFGEEKPPTGP